MADKHRPEVNLEISSGNFRIATDEVIYNLSIIPEGGGLPIVEKIVEVEKRIAASGSTGGVPDPYFQQVCEEALHRLAGLGRGLASLAGVMAGRKELGGDPRQIREARHGLAELKEAVAAKAAPSAQIGEDIAELVGKLQQVKALLPESGASPSAEDSPVAEEQEDMAISSPAASRYIFDLDVIFQTLYELCTNETVKTHITTARENRNTYFDNSLFLDRINEKVVHLEADNDNFLNVPISDVLASLLAACSEKPIQNLLKKMDSSHATIFLDSVLPLEVPATEEVGPGAAEDTSAMASEAATADAAAVGEEEAGRLEKTTALLDEVLQLVDAIAGKVAGEDQEEAALADTGAGGEELSGRIEQLDAILAGILPEDEEKTTESQGLAAFRQRLLEAVLTLEAEIRLKREDTTLTADQITQQATEAAGKAAAVQGQDGVEQLLEDLGL